MKLDSDQMSVCVCDVLSVPKCLLLASDKTCWAQWHFLFQSSDEGVSGDVTKSSTTCTTLQTPCYQSFHETLFE